MSEVNIPTFDRLMNPLIKALKELGGSGTIDEIDSRVAEIARLSDEQLEVLHNPDKGSQTEVEYRLAWTRTYLKKYGILENSSRGVWALTPKGRQTDKVNPQVVRRFVQDQAKQRRTSPVVDELDETEVQVSWRDELLDTLLQMDPSAFERLIQRLLRESGFTQVEVTGQTGDGGIDGKGIMRLGGLLEFPRHIPVQTIQRLCVGQPSARLPWRDGWASRQRAFNYHGELYKGCFEGSH
jgi:restriction system protein